MLIGRVSKAETLAPWFRRLSLKQWAPPLVLRQPVPHPPPPRVFRDQQGCSEQVGAWGKPSDQLCHQKQPACPWGRRQTQTPFNQTPASWALSSAESGLLSTYQLTDFLKRFQVF